MELKLNKEEICSSEIILRTRQEQPLELDYVLPDYCPEIFRIIKCTAEPEISSYSVNGSTLTYELNVILRILYYSENEKGVQVIEQKQLFTKSAELDRPVSNPEIIIIPSLDYINCRAVNKRKTDLRAAISVTITVKDICKSEIISDVYGMGVELHKIPVTYPVSRLYAEKKLSVSEEFELGISKSEIGNIIFCDSVITSADKKIIANKAVAKGEASVSILYSCPDGTVEPMEFSLPFSQIIDIEGIDERYTCYVEAEILSCEVIPRSAGDGRNTIAECKLDILAKCYADRMATSELADDEFSCEYETSHVCTDVKADCLPLRINAAVSAKTSVNFGDDTIIDSVCGAHSSVKNCSFTADSATGTITASGMAVYTLAAAEKDGRTIFEDKEESFNFTIPADNLTDDCILCLRIFPLPCSYNITSGKSVDIKADFKVRGSVYCRQSFKALTEITVDETAPIEGEKDCAMKLYYAESGENIWDIAKAYHASAANISEENELESDILSEKAMIVIL
jgi:hypothetical protein